MIQIMRASAGSGKTFSLARKYITLLFRKNDRHAYRHILAVTFTNKATDEMKSRILKELHILSTAPEKSGYLKWFIPEMFSPEQLSDVEEEDIVRELPGMPGKKITPDSLKAAARDMLSNLLHDYGAFAVSTIDRFFQQTLKAFSREIGQFASYQVELDKNSLIAESVDRILDSLTEDKPDLLRWLTESAMEQVERGEKYNIEAGLKAMAVRLKSDEHRYLAEKSGLNEAEMYSYESLLNTRKVCRKIISTFNAAVRGKAENVLALLERAGVPPEMFHRKFMARVRQYAALAPDDTVEALPGTFMQRAADHELWFAKSNAKLLDIVYPALEGPLNDFCGCFGTEFRAYNTARILSGQLYELGVASDLYREFEAVLKDRNVLSIDDSNVILKNIIDGADTPFIYEKTGLRFDNFLLDEFQDTSLVQWENFRPLIAESASKGEDNLVVGDVKQSIYRWRGSDWGLLDHVIQDDFSRFGIRETLLQRNFRSCRNIVDFNNAFFGFAAGELDRLYEAGAGGQDSVSKRIGEIYSDVSQEAAAADRPGAVKVTFCPPDEEIDAVAASISALHDRGVPFGDIAVLVRNNSSGGEIAAALISRSVPVITDDSLKVKSSAAVRRLVSLLSYADNPENTVNCYLASSLNAEMPDSCHSLQELCEAMCRALKKYDQKAFDGEITYICSFVDCLLDYVSMNGNDLHGFLKHWEEIDPDISSPASSDAVRVMTIHKSKGLDFRHVIFPFAEKVNLFRPGNIWCRLESGNTSMDGIGTGIYDVCLSDSSFDTLFRDDYLQERKKQYIDNINTFYVALTRAVSGLHVIAASPSAKFAESVRSPLPEYCNFSHLLYAWLVLHGAASGFIRSEDSKPHLHFCCGELYANAGAAGKSVPDITMLPSVYDSYPLNPEETADEDGLMHSDRLVFSAESADWFSDEEAGATSARVRGIVLHRILSCINSPADIVPAVYDAVDAGLVGDDEAEDLSEFFRSRLESVASMGWFPETGAKILNEAEIIDGDGSVYRPDRVVIREDGSVAVVDYKFGSPKPSYLKQIAGYADLWRRMGHENVTSHLWYVMSGEIVPGHEG